MGQRCEVLKNENKMKRLGLRSAIKCDTLNKIKR
jgi:hypothetical protein